MRHALLLCLLFIVSASCAYGMKGIVTDIRNAAPMADVTVVNLNNGSATISDVAGNFIITATNGDQLRFTVEGYTSLVITYAETEPVLKVQLTPQNIRLKEFVLHELTPFQKDSIAMHDRYQQELDRKRVKPKYAGGLAVDGLISSLAQGISKKYKENKKFKATFIKDEEQKFIDTRYTQKLVTSLTRLEGDSLVAFMNAYPMEYTFARTATDLELKMWVRDNYKKSKK